MNKQNANSNPAISGHLYVVVVDLMKRKLNSARLFMLVFVFVANCDSSGEAMQVPPRFAFPRALVQANPFAEVDPVEEDKTFDRATLKTDPDLEALMEKADRYRGDGNYRVASTLWQAVLQRSGDALYTDDDQTFYSLVQRVEQVLAGLPAEGLDAYRITADAEAQEILNQKSPHDVTALATVVQRYFISSIGDDAAYELGSIFLDRFDFPGARRLFKKVAQDYPDPSVPIDQVWLKIALCDSWLGNANAAEMSLQQAEQFGGSDAGSRNVDLVRRSIGELSFESVSANASNLWKSSLGNEARTAIMPAPPKELMQNELVALWQYYYEPKIARSERRDFEGSVRVGYSSFSSKNEQTRNAVEWKLIEAWQKKNWRPSGDLLFDQSHVYFRSVADMTAWRKDNIEQQIQEALQSTTAESVKKAADPFKKIDDENIWQSLAWRSVWRNGFEVDQKTATTTRQLGRWGGRNKKIDPPKPQSLPEIQLFGDKIASSVALHQDTVYAVEGPRFDDRNRASPKNFRGFRTYSVQRIRNNYLTAYDRVSGRVRWTLPKSNGLSDSDSDAVANANANLEAQPPNDDITGGGFMSAPIGYGNLVIVPVNTGGAISVYAIDPANEGQTVWKSYLCDEPETSADAWSPIALSISGSDLFVNCGMGVVFVLDPASGVVRFARRYDRSGKKNPFAALNSYNAPRFKEFDGWSQDIVLPYGKQMVCLSSDRNVIETYDRSTGEIIWRADTNPIFGGKVDYVIGVYNDVLYAGGFETIIAYSLKNEGQILWGGKTLFADVKSKGRAMVTPDGVFVPVGQSIVQYALNADELGNPQLLAKTRVNLGTKAPVGNLYCDGERIWVHGGNRLYALGINPDKSP